LESAAELSVSERARLANLKSELENINKKKEEYVKEHPEHRKLVYRARRQNDEEKKEPVAPQRRNLFKKNGLPRHPERSIYYDPVKNPFGVAPPGMPYMERRESFHAIHRSIFSDLPALRPDEIDSDEEDLGTFVD
jgi:mRNA biogenesis factor